MLRLGKARTESCEAAGWALGVLLLRKDRHQGRWQRLFATCSSTPGCTAATCHLQHAAHPQACMHAYTRSRGRPTCSTSSSSGTRVISGAPYFRSPRSNLQGEHGNL